MEFKIITGDLVEAFLNKEVDIFIHQANCFNTMGAGIAAQVKKKIYRLWDADQLTVRGDIKKLGDFSLAMIDEQIGINMYSQYRFGRDKRYTDYDALLKALENIVEWLNKMGMQGKTIGIPYMIGCKNAGGEWSEVEPRLKYAFHNSGYNVILYKFE